MSKESKVEGISSFQKYLSVWVLLCMAVGILIGKFHPAVPTFLDKLSFAGISIPIAILIWVMIYPISEIPDVDVAISMGCNVGCPYIGRTFDDNWGLEDPTGKSDEEFEFIIRKIEEKILELAHSI